MVGKKIKGVEKLSTGIKGFDTMMEGGIPKGRLILVTGTAGTGKTVLLNEFLYRGITEHGENGVFVTYEESPEDIIRNVGNFGWDYEELQKQEKLAFVDFSSSQPQMEEVSGGYDLSPILLRIKQAVKKTGARRIVLDSIAALFNQFSDSRIVRRIIYQISRELKEMGVTGMLTAEQVGREETFSRFGVEEFVTDGVLELSLEAGEQQLRRKICVMKMRGTGYRSGVVEFDITQTGIKVYPKITVNTGSGADVELALSSRRKTGIPGMDKALGGGFPKGYIVLVSGNTGSGKTLSGMQFLNEGMENGEKCVYVALEEPIQQLKKTAKAHGWDLHAHEKKGALEFIKTNLIDFSPNELLANITEVVERMNATRIVIDSISSIMSETMSREDVRQFLLQMTSFLKARGATCIINYLMTSSFGEQRGKMMGALQTSLMRLSSVVDGIILMQYMEQEEKVAKTLNILKMRGCNHSRDIMLYEIEKGGLRLKKK